MSEIKLFRVNGRKVAELQGAASDLEKPLQTLIEENLEPLLGIRFLASEYSTGKTHAGRIDTLGLDENLSPVILEYKRSTGENVINQGLFYLDWLMDHQAEFKYLVLEQFGKDTADEVDWSGPRLICVANDFTKYDSHAVQQMDRNIELIRYRMFGSDLLLLEQVNAVSTKSSGRKAGTTKPAKGGKSAGRGTDKTVEEWLGDMSPTMQELFASVEGYLSSLGDDVLRKDLKLYIAFKRIRNFATAVIQKDRLVFYLHVDPAAVPLEEGFTRDVSDVGHWGTGNLELLLRSQGDLEKAKPLFQQAYDGGLRGR
jgi:predicted transport protein